MTIRRHHWPGLHLGIETKHRSRKKSHEGRVTADSVRRPSPFNETDEATVAADERRAVSSNKSIMYENIKSMYVQKPN